jgi:DNA polymerase-3 subunit epsilon
MARSLVESGEYRVTSRLEAQAEYHPPDNEPKLVAAVVDVETTGTNPDRDKIIELGVCLFEYDRQSGRIYKVLGSWDWLENPGFSILPEITNITGITDEMVAGHRIDEQTHNDLLSRVVLVIAHNADFDRRFLERRLLNFTTKHWGCSRFDIDWKAESIRSSAFEFVAYSLGFFHDGHRPASDCRAIVKPIGADIYDIASLGGTVKPLSVKEVDALAEKVVWSPTWLSTSVTHRPIRSRFSFTKLVFIPRYGSER